MSPLYQKLGHCQYPTVVCDGSHGHFRLLNFGIRMSTFGVQPPTETCGFPAEKSPEDRMSKFVKCSELPRKPIWNLRGFENAAWSKIWEGEEEGEEGKFWTGPKGCSPVGPLVWNFGFKEVSLFERIADEKRLRRIPIENRLGRFPYGCHGLGSLTFTQHRHPEWDSVCR